MHDGGRTSPMSRWSDLAIILLTLALVLWAGH
jgi:hypothetical protein